MILRAASLALFALVSGCTVLVQPTEDRVRCQLGSSDPCPDGQRCIEGFCTPVPDGGPTCADREVGCNGIDDDCDGTVDEGSDFDGDGFTWCAESFAERDCRDDDATIYPGAPSDPPCDGADNDCSGTAAECPPGELCHPNGGCARPDCSFVNGICTSSQRCNLDAQPPTCEGLTSDNCGSDADCALSPGTICDPQTRTCIPPRRPGQECTLDAQCEGFATGARCFETAALELTGGSVAKICSRACCRDADCPDGSVCWASGTGARGCVPEGMLGSVPYEPCGRASHCADTCVMQNAPAAGDASRYAFVCDRPGGSGRLGDDCGTEWWAPWCRSNICLGGRCSVACGSNADCPGYSCGYVRIDGRDIVQACVSRSGSGSQGTSCTTPSDCSGAACIQGENGSYCADACCTDADCGTGSYVCRPANFGTFWGMVCQEPEPPAW